MSVALATACCALQNAGAAANFHHKISIPAHQLQSGFGFVYNEQDGGIGSALIGTYTISDEAFGQLLIRFDDAGTELGKAELAIGSGANLQQIWPIPDATGRFWAGYVHDDGYADFGVFNLSDRSPVFTRRIFLSTDAENATLTFLPNNTLALVQDLGLSVRVSIFSGSTGDRVFENSYTSDAFIDPDSLGSFGGSQNADLDWLPDGSGYLLTVNSSEFDIGGATISYDNSVVIAYLDNAGAVQSTARLQRISEGTLFASSSILSDNSCVLNILEQIFDQNTQEVTSKNHLFKFQTNGQLAWSTILAGASLNFFPVENANADLYLTGTKQVPTQDSSYAADAVLARISAATGALLSQAGVDRAKADSLSIGGATSNALFVTVLSSETGLQTSTVTLMKMGLDLGSVSMALEYERNVRFGFLSHDPADAELLFTTQEDSSKVGLISLNENFADSLSCDLFSPVDVVLANPGLTTETQTTTPTAITVTAADFFSESTSADFAPGLPVTESDDICTESPQPQVTLSASMADAVAFGETVSVNVTTTLETDAWTATSDAVWAVVESPAGGGGQGNGSISIEVLPNATAAIRTATITVNNTTFQITQAAPAGTVETSVTEDSGGLAGEIKILSQVAATIIASPFIDFALDGTSSEIEAGPLARNPAGGDVVARSSILAIQPGLTTINYSVSNTAPLNNRTGTVRVVDAGGNTLFTHTINQAGAGGVAPVNMSARTQVGTGANILIPGFVIGGTGKTRVLLRGVGPTLGDFGVTGVLADPQVVLYSGETEIGRNDTWTSNGQLLGAYFDEIGAFPLTSNLDTGDIFDLDPGPYTLHLRGADGGAGIGLAELYVLDASGSRGLVNLSARAEVGAGDRVMIPGFVIEGNESVQVLVRGAGPTLATLFGVAGVLDDPVIEVYDSGGVQIAINDDWETTVALQALKDAITTAGAFDLDPGSKDAAVLLTLSPGSYTAHIKGKGTSIGVALLEVYFLRGL